MIYQVIVLLKNDFVEFFSLKYLTILEKFNFSCYAHVFLFYVYIPLTISSKYKHTYGLHFYIDIIHKICWSHSCKELFFALVVVYLKNII